MSADATGGFNGRILTCLKCRSAFFSLFMCDFFWGGFIGHKFMRKKFTRDSKDEN